LAAHPSGSDASRPRQTDAGAVGPLAARQAGVPGGQILTRSQFLRQLHFERRRADRSKAPLSIVVARLEDCELDEAAGFRELAALLLEGRRETDFHGYLGERQGAALLPDTGPAGAQEVARKLNERAGGRRLSVTVATYPDDIFVRLLNVDASARESDPFLLEGVSNRGRLSLGVKRLIDVVGSTLLLIVASPLMLLTSVAIAATSRGPVVFRQVRLGQGGAQFVFYKFRSMRVDANDQIHRDYVSSLIDGRLDQVNQGDAEKPRYKIKADPRVTGVGRVIRATSIDELPQLFNVLKGDMSLVGPRPPLPYEAEQYESWHLRRILEVRPGITGLWQVEGRSRTSFDDMVRLDLRYSADWSLWLDFTILARTVLVVLGRDGAG
jgi:lipopolysaccharide/colanic/teichoic acid biosynthesis glycosyltransferase